MRPEPAMRAPGRCAEITWTLPKMRSTCASFCLRFGGHAAAGRSGGEGASPHEPKEGEEPRASEREIILHSGLLTHVLEVSFLRPGVLGGRRRWRSPTPMGHESVAAARCDKMCQRIKSFRGQLYFHAEGFSGAPA